MGSATTALGIKGEVVFFWGGADDMFTTVCVSRGKRANALHRNILPWQRFHTSRRTRIPWRSSPAWATWGTCRDAAGHTCWPEERQEVSCHCRGPPDRKAGHGALLEMGRQEASRVQLLVLTLCIMNAKGRLRHKNDSGISLTSTSSLPFPLRVSRRAIAK